MIIIPSIGTLTKTPWPMPARSVHSTATAPGDGERWYAVQTLQYAEKRAQAQLAQQKFRTFLPKRRKTIRHARKLSTVTAAFFPGYLFVQLDLNRDRWRSVNGTFGISSLVMAGELPCPVPSGVVETMLALADDEGLLQLNSNLKVGASVRMAAGPFAEQLGVIDRLDNAGRIRVLLNILGRQVPVRLNRNYALPAA
jgi:transcription elongation factor/antiterminator RfaH